MTLPPKSDRVPCYLLKKLILDRIDPVENRKMAGFGPQVTNTLEALSETSGVSSRIIRRIVNGDKDAQEYIKFQTADKITTALHINEIWQTEEWAPHYGPFPVAWYEKDLQEREQAAA